MAKRGFGTWDIDGTLRNLQKKMRESMNLKDVQMSIVDVNEYAWDILAALRGPDTEFNANDIQQDEVERLKTLSTCRLRYFLGLSATRTNIHCELLSNAEIVERNNLMRSVSTSHFRMHLKDAFRALSALGYDVPREELNFNLKIER
jgi:hypothetical protein